MFDAVFRKRRRYRVVVCVLLAGCLSGCGQSSGFEDDYRTYEGKTMGTYYRVTAACLPTTHQSIAQLIDEELQSVNGQMSTYLADSELSRLNRTPVDQWFSLSDETLAVLKASLALHADSLGAFDVTVGGLVDLWGFGPTERVDQVPTDDAIEDERKRVGSQHLQLDTGAGRVRRRSRIKVDLSAIAKGHGVDRLAELLADGGCRDYLVDIGGEVRGLGNSPKGRPWQIGVEIPDHTRYGGVHSIIVLRNVAVATSGDYRNFLPDKPQYSHTIDPRTARPVTHGLASVTVVADRAQDADALATALSVLGLEAGLPWAEERDIAAFFLQRQATGLKAGYTQAMKVHFQQPLPR